MNPPCLIGGSTPPLGSGPCDGFDAYSATVFANPDALFEDLQLLLESAGFACLATDGLKARFYARNRQLVDFKGHQLLSVKSGGANPHPHVECTGRASQTLARYLREGIPHRPTRIDHAVDLQAAGLFHRLNRYSRRLAKQHRLKWVPKGDWVTPDAGRTVELGSRSSQVFVRIYEKGLEYANKQGVYITDELRNWVRIEIEFKPQTQAAKTLALSVEGPQLWGSTSWTDQLAREVLSMDTQPVSIRQRRESNRERALRFMGAQYSAHLRALLVECQGDPAEFGRAIMDLAGLADADGVQAA